MDFAKGSKSSNESSCHAKYRGFTSVDQI